jgi:hypothetical protein
MTFSAVVMCLVGCASSATKSQVSRKCFTASIAVTALDENGKRVSPGAPTAITIRSKSGYVLRTASTDSNGAASVEVCWTSDDPPWQIEAALHYGPQFVGTFASFWNYSDTYCLTLPAYIGGHCGEWGKGPQHLLEEPRTP